MPGFESGVKAYVRATATVTVSFPVNFKGEAAICCEQCMYYRRSYQTCGLNNAICEYPRNYVGSRCPLEMEAQDETIQTTQGK